MKKQKKPKAYHPSMRNNMSVMFTVAAKGNKEEAERLARRVQALADESAARARTSHGTA